MDEEQHTGPIYVHPTETTYEEHDDEGSKVAGTLLGVVVALAVAMGVIVTLTILLGCGSALADQCDALYAGADTPEKMQAADAACAPDGGAQ